LVAGERRIKRIILPCPSKTKVRTLIESCYPDARPAPNRLAEDAARVQRFLSRESKTIDLKLDLSNIPAFHRQIYQLTQNIPYGQVQTYGWLAKAAGNPAAARAVGNALARNPLPLAVPCHRVIRSDGNLGGFRGGIALKMALLRLEGCLLGGPF
jgi:O-6-methylguanine DNA methyltransferase